MSNRSFWGLSLPASTMPFVAFSASAWRAASTWASICWVFTYMGISAAFGVWPLFSGRLLISKDPEYWKKQSQSQPAELTTWSRSKYVPTVLECLVVPTLLQEDGFPFISPVFTMPSLVVRLIHRARTSLIKRTSSEFISQQIMLNPGLNSFRSMRF